MFALARCQQKVAWSPSFINVYLLINAIQVIVVEGLFNKSTQHISIQGTLSHFGLLYNTCIGSKE